MEETTVMTEAPQAATVFAFGPEDAPVDAVQDDGSTGTESQTTEETDVTQGDVGPTGGMTQDDVGKAFAAERKRLEAKYKAQMENDPTYQVGKMMVEDLMETGGLSAEEAAKKAKSNFLKAVAKREGISQSVANRLYGEKAEKQFTKEAKSVEDEINEKVEEVMSAEKPAGFDAQTAFNDPYFAQLLNEYPVKAAMRIYAAEARAQNAGQDIAERLQSRNAVPKLTRPTQPVSPRTDWTKVDSKTFAAEKARRQSLR